MLENKFFVKYWSSCDQNAPLGVKTFCYYFTTKWLENKRERLKGGMEDKWMMNIPEQVTPAYPLLQLPTLQSWKQSPKVSSLPSQCTFFKEFIMFGGVLRVILSAPGYPSWRQTTNASWISQLSKQMASHTPLWYISTCPLWVWLLLRSLTALVPLPPSC